MNLTTACVELEGRCQKGGKRQTNPTNCKTLRVKDEELISELIADLF